MRRASCPGNHPLSDGARRGFVPDPAETHRPLEPRRNTGQDIAVARRVANLQTNGMFSPGEVEFHAVRRCDPRTPFHTVKEYPHGIVLQVQIQFVTSGISDLENAFVDRGSGKSSISKCTVVPGLTQHMKLRRGGQHGISAVSQGEPHGKTAAQIRRIFH